MYVVAALPFKCSVMGLCEGLEDGALGICLSGLYS